MTVHERLPILVAVGDSDAHDAALRFAAEQAVREHRPLRLVHVLPSSAGGMFPEQMLVSFEAATLVAQQLLSAQAEHAEDLVHGQVAVEKTLRRGPVVEQLLELSLTADRVVLQHRQQGKVRRVFTGSVCAGMAGRAAVPVVSVPELWVPSDRPPEVLVGLDGTGDHRALLAHAFAEADRRNAALRVLHAWFVPTMYDNVIVDRVAQDEWEESAGRIVDVELQPYRRAHPSVDVRIDVVHKRPADALVERAGHSALLVVGRRGAAHGLTHLGSVTRAVIRESPCPVTIVAPAAVGTSGRDEAAVEEPVMSP
jgi:nucleotide-binding universal stress UspA family protein